ncbi:MAG: hypothetical protein WKF32_00770 [Thermoleophilaceae bacterium]
MNDESEQHFNSTEQAYSAGVNKGKELQKQADEEERGAKEQSNEALTYEALKEMTAEELTERKDEVDAVLEAQGRQR